MLEAAVGILAQAAGDDPLDLARQRRDLGWGLRLLVEDGRQSREGGLAAEGAPPGKHLVEDGAEAENVRARVQLPAFRLLRRHVAEGADDGALYGLGAG